MAKINKANVSNEINKLVKTPSDLLDEVNLLVKQPYLKEEIEKQFNKATVSLQKEFSDILQVHARMEDETYLPPYAMSWSFSMRDGKPILRELTKTDIVNLRNAKPKK